MTVPHPTTPEVVRELMFNAFKGDHDMRTDLRSAEQGLSTSIERLHNLGRQTLKGYRDGGQPGRAFHKEMKRRQYDLEHYVLTAALLKTTLDTELADEQKRLDERIRELLSGQIVEVRILEGMEVEGPVRIRNGKLLKAYNSTEESIRGRFMDVDSAEGRLTLRHFIRELAWDVQVVGERRGLIRSFVELSLADAEPPRLALQQ